MSNMLFLSKNKVISGLVAGILLVNFSANSAFSQGWVSPATHADESNKWKFEDKAYDADTSTYASDRSNRSGYGAWLNLTPETNIQTSRVRVSADFGYGIVDKVEIQVKESGQWKQIFDGPIQDVAWTEITFTSSLVEDARFRFHYTRRGYYFWLFEFQFYQDPPQVNPPVGSTLAATSVEESSAVLHGKVVSDGGEPVQYRFQWGLTTEYQNASDWSGSLASDEPFQLQISDLANGNAYRYRAQIKNSAGIVSGEDRVFVTAPSGSPWISPATTTGSDPAWEIASASHDDELNSFARVYHNIGEAQWGRFIQLNHLPLVSDKIRLQAKKSINIDLIDIDIQRKDSVDWEDVYEGTFEGNQWLEQSFAPGWVQAARVRFHIRSKNIGEYFQLHEFDFHSLTNRWIHTAGDFKWHNSKNWSLGHVPVAGEAVIFDTSSQATCEADANTVAQDLNSLVMTEKYIGQVEFADDFAAGYSQVLRVTDAIEINGGSFVVNGRVINTVVGTGVTLQAGRFVVGSGGILHSDGRGYPPLYGPGASDTHSFGASHGGRGEDNRTNLPYGDPKAPTTLGSGGSVSTSAAKDPGGQWGGGAILIDVADGNVKVDGQIRCNADDDGFHNTGSGGSIWIQCGTFTGNGLLQARGGNINNAGRSPGAGGRIAVDWSQTSSFEGSFDVSGGADPNVTAQSGTISLPGGANLKVKAPHKLGLAPGSHNYGTIMVLPGAELFCHSNYDENLVPHICSINAMKIQIDAGGVISADGVGYAPEVGPGSHVDGGSHGGRGAGDLPAYGSALQPTSLGGGGRKFSWPGRGSRSPRWGGGAIKISAENLIVNGVLHTNGESTTSGGGGAGGSIWLDVDKISGTGSIEANGGTGNGGGGRIALYATENSFSGIVSAAGDGSGESGSVVPGSLIVQDSLLGPAENAFAQTGDLSEVVLFQFSLNPLGNTDQSAFEPIEIRKLIFDLN